MDKAAINKIIPFSNVDGPGNRTTIFFQSCTFSCLYCHNPETIHMCNHCGDCVALCPVQALSKHDGKVIWDQDRCVDCDTCIKTCKHLSSPKITYMSVAEVVAYIQKHRMFIEGITVSGGECMVHADFILALFKEVKKLNLSCLIDSNGAYDFRLYPELISICDGVMLDVKAVDEVFHQKICHYDNKMVLQNLEYLQNLGKLEEVRTVLLSDHTEQNEKSVAYVSRVLHDQIRYKLLRYRYFGVREEGIAYFGKKVLSLEEAQTYVPICCENGHHNVVIV